MEWRRTSLEQAALASLCQEIMLAPTTSCSQRWHNPCKQYPRKILRPRLNVPLISPGRLQIQAKPRLHLRSATVKTGALPSSSTNTQLQPKLSRPRFQSTRTPVRVSDHKRLKASIPSYDVGRSMAVPPRGPHKRRQPFPPSLLHNHVQRSGMVKSPLLSWDVR